MTTPNAVMVKAITAFGDGVGISTVSHRGSLLKVKVKVNGGKGKRGFV